jgi:hypothetical protein
MSAREPLTLDAGEYTVIIRDACPYDDPIPELDQPFMASYGDVQPMNQARYIVEVWARGEKLRACLLYGWNGSITRVNSQTAIVHGDRCIIGIMADMLALHMPSLRLMWSNRVDDATCFGVYHVPEYQSYISHGELDIARVSYAGDIMWSSGGKDIFTNGFEIDGDHIIAVDFNDERYHIDLMTGKSRIIP